MSSTTPSTTQSPSNIDLSSLSSPTFSASSYLNDFLSTIPSTSLKPALQNLSLQTNLEIQRTHTHLQTLQRRVISVLQGAPQSLSRASSSLARVSEAQTVLQGGVDELPEAPEATSRLMDLHSRLEELEVMEKTMEGITRFEDTSRMVAKNIAGRDIEEGEFKRT
jgi:esterase/lipase